MDIIGPITGIRPMTAINPTRSVEDLSGIASVKFGGRDQEESYTPSHQKASRGLEDEEEDGLGTEDDAESSAPYPAGVSKISFFA